MLFQADLINFPDFFLCKIQMVHNGDVLFYLFRTGSADENGSNFVILQDPGKSHLCKCLTSFQSQMVQFIDLMKALRCQRGFFQEAVVSRNPAVGGDSMQVFVRQKPLSSGGIYEEV